jgi:hypothetical protein
MAIRHLALGEALQDGTRAHNEEVRTPARAVLVALLVLTAAVSGVALLSHRTGQSTEIPAAQPQLLACVRGAELNNLEGLRQLYRPSQLNLSCSEPSPWLGKIAWHTWGATGATGVADLHYLSCAAVFCYPGRHFWFQYRVEVALTRNSTNGSQNWNLRLTSPSNVEPCASIPTTDWRLTTEGPKSNGGGIDGDCI